jgi:hypothetical protein
MLSFLKMNIQGVTKSVNLGTCSKYKKKIYIKCPETSNFRVIAERVHL